MSLCGIDFVLGGIIVGRGHPKSYYHKMMC